MAQCDQRRFKLLAAFVLICSCALRPAETRRPNGDKLTACQHLRRAEFRRSKALTTASRAVRVPRCTKEGAFEPIQCMNEKKGLDCWCVDEYGIELPGTRNRNKSAVSCVEPANCPAAECRMFCPSGFARDPQTNCSICRCHDPCDGLECPNGQACQLQEVNCKNEPCPPVPTCKKARSIANYCPAGLPLSIENSVRPFLCGNEAGKPKCPPLYKCIVESGNDYGVCCPPSALKFQKPGFCPKPDTSHFTEATGYMCGTPCTHDLECTNMDKCCFTKGCQFSCQKPYNVTSCHQARALSDVLAISEREGRGYVPDCSGPGGIFSARQCSRNGLVCWCVDPGTGHKIKNTMGAAVSVNCEEWENMISSRSGGRSMNDGQCDINICAAVCEYGFKNDHNGCPTCECAEPCEGYKCPPSSRCEVATDPKCESGSTLCASWPVCKPDLVYSNPCEVGTPLAENVTGEVMYCSDERKSRAFQPTAFFEPELKAKEARSLTTTQITCPKTHKCTKLHRQAESVCCPVPIEAMDERQLRQQTMCEYLRDFSERMEGTEADMQLAVPAPRCTNAGHYRERQCIMKAIWVTRSEQRTILEENTIRRMRMLLGNETHTKRSKRGVERLKLYRVDDNALKVQLATQVMGRNAKVIDMSTGQQGLGQLFGTELKKTATVTKTNFNDNELVEMKIEECWCVDNFGTEIPRSRGYNVTDEACISLREEIDCLDLTCRMGCEYGFTLDPDTRCPACQCRDPCDGVTCTAGKECRIVDVSCDEEYCPPVPACLPRKQGQCPFLVPPGSDNQEANSCTYECRTDSHCEGAKRCCSNGCGTQCIDPQMKTACQHLHSIQMHQSSELGIPAMKMHLAQCDASTGKWKQLQCGPAHCWCVDEQGQEISGTRVKGNAPVCVPNSAFKCPEKMCTERCESGYKVDKNGCLSCECRNFCDELSCSSDEECQLINVECIDKPCPKMPICVPRRESMCPEGSPWKQADVEVSCGPHNENEVCPTTHACQLNPVSNRGVCCTKTRDVCFESLDNVCLSNSTSVRNITRYRFSPKANRCIRVTLDLSAGICQTKNLFHNEMACNSVCPVLTQCERLKLKNSLVAQRSNQPAAVWFQPRCDPISGHWSPVQCLGRQMHQKVPSPVSKHARNTSRASEPESATSTSPYGVCWCADKKGAPLKGTLTRDSEPVCNSRQARGRSFLNSESNPLMEQLIRQMTMLVDVDNFLQESDMQAPENKAFNDNMAVESQTETILAPAISVTERVLELANSLLDSQLSVESTTLRPLAVLTTRCRAMAKTAPFPVSCDEKGGFFPIQCNAKMCWCVDAAGNQLAGTNTFRYGTKKCDSATVRSVAIELHMENQRSKTIRNVYDIIQTELRQLLGDALENLRVQENSDGSLEVRFELHNEDKVDLAYAIESAISEGRIQLAGGHFKPEITRSHFIHRIDSARQVTQASTFTENTIHLVVFIMGTSSAFLVSIFVVYIMLKRGKEKVLPIYSCSEYPQNRIIGSGDKAIDYTSPIFILNAVASEHHAHTSITPAEEKNTTDSKVLP